MNLKQFLGTKIFENRYLFIDYWSILHLILFFIFGVTYPNQWGLVILVSIIYEFIENRLSKKAPFWKEPLRDTLSDFAFNFIGYWLGMTYGGGLI